MKKPRIFGAVCTLLMSAALLMSGASNASTVFAPLDGDVNFLNTTIDFSGGTTLVAMFNVGGLGSTNNTLVLGASLPASVAVFSPVSGGNYQVDSKVNVSDSSSFDNMTLLGTDNFILGLSNDSGSTWVADTGATSRGGSFYDVHFANGDILQVDVRVVPVPAAVWLFGSGLIGLAGMARRKKTA